MNKIEDIARRYSKTEEDFVNILYKDLTQFNTHCSTCYSGECNLPYKKNKCFEQYLVDLGYSKVERRKQNIPVVIERREKTIEDIVQQPEKKKKKK